MRIRISVSKLANQFFFISTLAAWHHSARKEDREAWIHMTGKLTPTEEKLLAAFGNLMKTKYGFQSPKTYLGEIFYKNTERGAWKKLKEIADEKDYALIREVFSTFHGRFNRAWNKRNEARVKVLKKALRGKKTVDFFDAMALTFGGKAPRREVLTIIVLFSPQSGNFTAAGSANLAGNFITLELPDIKDNTWQLSYSLTLIGHEVGHLYFQNRGGKKMIGEVLNALHLKKQYATLPFSTTAVINEAVTSSFAPAGALAQRYFSGSIADILFSDLPRGMAAERALREKRSVSYYSNLEIYFVWKMFPTALEYLQEKKPIDKPFVNMIGSLLKNLLR